ncbi:MAG: Nif11-like leader peptide family natural product precursor [Symploca sp. SIO2E9]|nr:Nif11-like leader peptide family natural product precursor [Symploca sp. SIO2E9]
MSQASVLELIKSSQENQALQQRLEAADSPETIMKIGVEKGYNFTEEELLSVMQEIQQVAAEEGELSEDELEAVAGGGWSTLVSTAITIFNNRDKIEEGYKTAKKGYKTAKKVWKKVSSWF